MTLTSKKFVGPLISSLLSMLLIAISSRAESQSTPDPIVLGHTSHSWSVSGQAGIRGINIGPIESSQWPNRGYGSKRAKTLLRHLSEMGASWVSLTPFGRIWDVNSQQIHMDFEAPYEKNRKDLRRMIRMAHSYGLRVLVIPMLWVEASGKDGGDGPGWRGEIDPGSPRAWSTYHDSYEDFILAWAKDAGLAGADAFSIGVECKSWSNRFPERWHRIIEKTRKVFPGVLTYAANWWEEVHQVVFLDALDLIGIQAFYVLADQKNANYSDYLEGAQRAKKRVFDLVQSYDKPILFTEVGYTSRPHAGVDPWTWPDNMQVPVDEGEQARALAAVFETFLHEPWFTGFFVWRYYADLDDISQEDRWGFSPHAKQAETLLTSVFHSSWGVDASGFQPWESNDWSLSSATSRSSLVFCREPIWSCGALRP